MPVDLKNPEITRLQDLRKQDGVISRSKESCDKMDEQLMNMTSQMSALKNINVTNSSSQEYDSHNWQLSRI